jgi:hypothetical protein
MSKTLLIVIIVILCSLHARPQTPSAVRVKGRIADKDSQQPLTDATVALLRTKDSSSVASGFTDSKGAFSLEEVKAGSYQLYVTFLGYRPVLHPVEVRPSDTLVDLGTISLQGTGVSLKTVEIVQVRAPMVIKRDTLEFNAAHYKTRENAVMEELLQKLPGVQIEKDGTIKINGQPVKRILVNGKPFFGDDPKMATRNLPADMIDKIQLVDKKSDQAQFSGVDDGKKEKAINITIRKDRKGMFLGQITGGYGTDARFAGKGHLSRFSDGEQLSVLAEGNNINGYSDGQTRINSGNGISRNWRGGVNYSRDISPKLKVSGSYMVNDGRTENERNVARQNLLPDTTYYYNQDNRTADNNTFYNFDMRTEYKPDTMHTINVSGGFSYSKNKSDWESLYESLSGKQELVNRGELQNSSAGNVPSYNINVLLGKKFKKTGRAASINFSLYENKSNQENFNRSHNLFFQSNGEILADTINQRSDIGTDNSSIQLSATYTEPVFKDRFIDLLYIYSGNYMQSDKLTYDYNAAGKIYDKLNDSLSNSFRNNYAFHLASLSFRTVKKKYEYSLGAYVRFSDIDNNNISQQSQIRRSVFNIFPMASMSYIFNNNKRLQFYYSGSAMQPDLSQMQPVPDNSNPLYIKLGNPDLKLAVVHNFNMWYNTFNAGTMYGFSTSANLSIFPNKIVNANWFDSLGRQLSQPVNVSGAYNFNINVVNALPLKKEGAAINTNTTFSVNRDINIINGVKGAIQNYNIAQELSFNYAHKDVLNLSARASVLWSGIRYSTQKSNNSNFFSYYLSSDISINLPAGFIIGTNADYLLNTGRAEGYNQNAVLLNAYISKSLFQNKRGSIKVQGFDLLSQNLSITRNVGENYIEDVQARILKRFFLVSFSYYLKKKEEHK